MTDFRIRITVDTSQAQRGSREVERGLNRVGDAATRVQRLIRNAFAFGSLGLAIREVVRMADTFTNLENRTRLLTTTQTELNGVMQSLFDVSSETRSSFASTATIYSRVGLAARELGVSQAQLIDFTRSLNQAVILSGASVREAEFALIQLSQGIASGTLRGDELRSVLEQLPAVADVIAERLGVTRGELRLLGAEGKISAQVVLDAFEDAAPRLAEAFATTEVTIGQALTVLRNEATRFIAAFDDALGGGSGIIANGILALANGLRFLAENADTVSRAAGVLATVLLTRLVVSLIQTRLAAGGVVGQMIALEVALGASSTRAAVMAVAMKGAQRAMLGLSAAIAANPIGLLLTAIAAVISALVFFGDQIEVTADGVVTLEDVFVASFQIIGETIAPVVEFMDSAFKEAFAAIGIGVDGVVDAIKQGAGFILQIWKNNINAVIALFVGGYRSVVATWNLLPAAFKDLGAIAINGLLSVVEKGINGIISAVSDLLELIGSAAELVGASNPFEGLLSGASVDLSEFRQEVTGAAGKVGETFAAEFNRAFTTDFIGDGINAVLERARTIAEERRRLEAEETTFPTLPGPRGGAGTPGEVGSGSGRNREAEKALELAKDRADMLARINRELDHERELLGLSSDEREVQQRLFQVEEQFRNKGLELTALELQGIEDKIRANQRLEQALTFVSDVTESVFSRVDSAISDFIQTGEFNFKTFASNIVADLARIATQALVIRPLLQGLGNAIGGNGFSFTTPDFGSILGSIGGFQRGGSVIAGGTGGPDSQLFVTRVSPGERIDFTPEGEGSGRGGDGVNINFNITTPDVEGFRRSQSQLAARASRLVNAGRRNT